MRELQYIFIHGAGGWGSYDAVNRFLPYWGMFTGDLISFLNRRGFACRAASVAPSGSLWARACELYAQIAGVRTDYGKKYSEDTGTERYGTDYTGRALIPGWDDDTRLVLLGHSMGGGTARLFAHLLTFGAEDERAVTPPDELSPLFAGGMGKRVHSIIALASPMNGSASPDMLSDPSFDAEKIRVPLWSRLTMRILSLRLRTGRHLSLNGRVSGVDPAVRQNEKIKTLPDVYYFSIPCASTLRKEDGTEYPDPKKTEILYFDRSIRIGAYPGSLTSDGFMIDGSWRRNDGLVSTVSAEAPFGAPRKPYDRDRPEKGVWQVFPVFDGDHMSVQGGFFIRRDMRWFYLDLLGMIEELP